MNNPVMTYDQFKSSKFHSHPNVINLMMSNDGLSDQYILNTHQSQYIDYLHNILNDPNSLLEDRVQSNVYLINIGLSTLKYDY